MASSAFIPCSILLLCGAFVAATPREVNVNEIPQDVTSQGIESYGMIDAGKGVINGIGSTVGNGIDKAKNMTTGIPILGSVGNAISDGKDVVSNIGSSVSQGISNSLDKAKNMTLGNPIVSGVGNAISGAVSGGKDVVSNIGSSVSQGISNSFDKMKNITLGNPIVSGVGNAISSGKDAVSGIVSSVNNGIENVKGVAQTIQNIFGKGKDVGKWVIDGLTPSETQGIIKTYTKIMAKVSYDLVRGKDLATSIVDRTIEETAKMDLMLASLLRRALLRVQALQKGEKISTVAASIARDFFNSFGNKIKALAETFKIVSQEYVEKIVGMITKCLEKVLGEKEKRTFSEIDRQTLVDEMLEEMKIELEQMMSLESEATQ